MEPHGEELENSRTDEEIAVLLGPHSVEYMVEEEGEEEGMHLCMACTQLPSFVVASHGQGSSPSAAKRDASLRLIQNISQLAKIQSQKHH